MNRESTTRNEEIKKSLGLEPTSGRGKHFKFWLILGVLLLIVILAMVKWGLEKKSSEIRHITSQAQRGNLTVTVSATGNLEPTNQVDVGTEVSGTVAAVEVDYNDEVKAGQVLARLDTTKLEAQMKQSQAAVASARANLLQAEASVLEAGNELARLHQLRDLTQGRTPSLHDLDIAEATLKRARADEAISQANIAEAEARLQVDRTNLDKAIILSPINGVVLKRSVEPGQTVAASLQAPILFTLAEDLTQMELHVDVDEADVGRVEKGQQGTFTVDAYPDRVFPARIIQVRYGSEAVEGVVTYPAVLNVDNRDLSLRPGMTATADIVVQQSEDVLLVPNAALRYTPPQKEEKVTEKAGGSLLSKLFPRPSRTGMRKKTGGPTGKQRQVWTLRDQEPVAIPVTIGASDGIMTEILQGEITAGMELITESIGKKE
jgi:HlyD family secretion protein